ncbi:DUF302 domain-containing protein [Thalassococcus sp. BH17M4-6]|uniref:DUF302 domain-containing protein n=1 Tax=Thalassococcus sp. BH17M4-6 TaxID=3413148 RepID=UPI003BE3F251
MKHALALVGALALAPILPQGAAAQDIMTDASQKSVDATVDQLVSAIEGAGATVFAVVDHGAGAKEVDMDIGNSKLVIFGNPQVGTPAMMDNRQAGLFLPMKVLVYEDAAGIVTVAYEDPMALTALEGISEDAEYLGKMQGALKKLTGAAVE